MSGEDRVLVCCWSSKGGSGTTVVAAALAVVLSRTSPVGALLVDLAGDLPSVLGLAAEPDGAGVAEWLGEGDLVPADGLARVEVLAHGGLSVLPRGRGPLRTARAGALAALLAADPRPVVVDGGLVGTSPAAAVAVDDRTALVAAIAASADHSLLVVRPCFLALRRAVAAA